MTRREIDVVVYREGRQWVATALNVEVSSFGPTREEALASVREALELYFEGEESPVVQEASEAGIERLVV
jgi:predicted RNase H-like HicB family nuclease